MSLSVLNPSLCLYISISPGRMCLFQGHVACWNLTQWGLIVKVFAQANFQHFILPSKSFYSKFR